MTVDFITLSNRPEHCQKLIASIPLMVGNLASWNVTVVDGNKYDLFTGYNQGAAQTTGDILVFVHDDVQFLGNPIIMNTFLGALADPKVGFIGVAGTRYLQADGCWWGQHNPEVLARCRGMAFHTGPLELGIHANVWPPGVAEFGRAVVLDGVVLICRRNTFNRLGGFDAQTYKGFHFYDLDITLRAALDDLTNLVMPIPILHDTLGKVPFAWEVNRQIFVQKFAQKLPIQIAP